MIRKLGLAMMVLLLTTIIACASNPPQAVITCYGCDEISEGRLIVYVDSGSKIALNSASSQDDVGIISRIWTKNGKVMSNDIQYSPIVMENTEYVLTVADGEGKSDSETVEVRLNYVAPPNYCLPDWEGEILSSNKDEYENEGDDLLVGDEITLNANVELSDCVYEIEWSTRDNNIIFSNKSSVRTKVQIGRGTAIGKHTIKVVLSNSEKSREHEIKISVVRNTPPTIIISYEYPLSYDTLYVDFSESETGSDGNEYNDYIQRCYVRLEDESGNLVSDGSWDVDRNRMPISVEVRTVKMGNHSINATIEDSHVAVSTAMKRIWVREGNSIRDPLIVKAPDNVTCIAGEECRFSAYQTYLRYKGKGIRFEYYDITYRPERLGSPDGHYLTGPYFRHIFPYKGNFTVKIVVTNKYRFEPDDEYRFKSDDERFGYKIVNITVLDNETVESTLILTSTSQEPTPTPTLVSTKLVVSQSTPYLSESPAKIPGMEIWTAIIMIIMAVAFIRRE
ncbi:MAG: hypothetical protein U9P70_04995 [Patescibacteria group bacterium]|nr:hypothetical protein [Patescibacteria group bacterium]